MERCFTVLYNYILIFLMYSVCIYNVEKKLGWVFN